MINKTMGNNLFSLYLQKHQQFNKMTIFFFFFFVSFFRHTAHGGTDEAKKLMKKRKGWGERNKQRLTGILMGRDGRNLVVLFFFLDHFSATGGDKSN